MSKKSILTVLFVLLIYPFNCFANLTVEEYEKLQAGSQSEQRFAKTYLKGLGDGYLWSNGELFFAGRETLFCQPDGLGLGNKQYDAILQNYLLTSHPVHDQPLGMILLDALVKRFPCAE
jgi:hypothetical protein